MKRAFLLLTGILMASILSVPGASASDSGAELPQVVVTATKTAQQPQDVTQSVTVITGDEIRQSGAQTVADVLHTAVGTEVTDQGPIGSLTSVKIRGASYQQVLVLLDGVRMNDPAAGGFDLSELPVPLDAIDRIEIVRGPASALYGSDAVGGVVNIITKTPSAKPETTVGMTVGERGYNNQTLGTLGKQDKLSYRLNAGNEHSAGYRVNSSLDKKDGSLHLAYAVNDAATVELTTDYLEKNIGVPGLSSAPSPNANQENRDATTALGATLKLSPTVRMKLNGYQKGETLDYQDPDIFLTSRHKTTTREGDVQIDWLLGSWNRITLGAVSRRDSLQSTDAGSHAETLSAAYIQDEITLGDSFLLVLGGRNDRQSIYGSQWSPKASARYLIASTGTILRASYGKSFRAPTFNDLYWAYSNYPYTDTTSGITTNYITQGNPNLVPESAEEFEGGVEQPFGKGSSVKITGFRRRIHNLIQWQEFLSNPTPSTVNDLFQPVNIGRARISGYEAEARLALTDAVVWTVNFTRLFPVDELTGARITSPASPMPNMQVGSSLDAALGDRTHLGLDGQWVDNYVAPGSAGWRYYTVDGKLTETLVARQDLKTDLFVGMKNIFNRTYEVAQGYPMPPAEVYGGLSVRF